MNIDDQLKEIEAKFDKKFPAFEGSGAPYPMFSETPNRNHIKQFFEREIRKLVEERDKERENRESHDLTIVAKDPYLWKCNNCGNRYKEGDKLEYCDSIIFN
jgi:hypothetical protein